MAVAEFSKLPLLTQTAYARLLDLLLTSEAGSPADSASLVSKTIGGRRYWYAQRREGGKKVQSYIGPRARKSRRWSKGGGSREPRRRAGVNWWPWHAPGGPM